MLVFKKSDPKCVEIDGRAANTGRIGVQLLKTLAMTPGKTYSYRALNSAVWKFKGVDNETVNQNAYKINTEFGFRAIKVEQNKGLWLDMLSEEIKHE